MKHSFQKANKSRNRQIIILSVTAFNIFFDNYATTLEMCNAR